jgi:cathepsin L
MKKSNLNHVSLLVGYTEEYWIIKESMGTNWGVQGYVYVSRETNKNCGIGYYWATLKN